MPLKVVPTSNARTSLRSVPVYGLRVGILKVYRLEATRVALIYPHGKYEAPHRVIHDAEQMVFLSRSSVISLRKLRIEFN